MKKILIIIGAVLLAALVFWATRWFYQPVETHTEINAQVLQEKIKQVSKLVTVEGNFSEIYSFEEYWKYNLSPLRKKALVRAKAKVAVGFDLSNMGIQADEKLKKITLSNIPQASILYIDHEFDYYDITQGTFNTFTKEDYNKIQNDIKERFRRKAYESSLFEEAQLEGNQTIEMIRFLVENLGWQLEIRTPPPPLSKENKENSKTLLDSLFE